MHTFKIGDKVQHVDFPDSIGYIKGMGYENRELLYYLVSFNDSEQLHTTPANKLIDTVPAGTKYDSDKPKHHLIDPVFLDELAKVLTLGAEKYGEHNWQEGLSTNRIYSAAQRHLLAWHKGVELDNESGLHHSIHVAANMMFLAWYDKKKKKDSKLV